MLILSDENTDCLTRQGREGRIVLERKEVDVVSVAADVQHGVDPTLHSGGGAVGGVGVLLVPGTAHGGVIEELLLLKLPLSHRLKWHEEFLVLGLRSGLVGHLEHEKRERQNIQTGQFPSTSFLQSFKNSSNFRLKLWQSE